ncbi:hypothetical protein JR316_0005710 [Psilocybe cubensis]|uniref:Uncharacterized protein n=2 Tax=Psilocybe cubensis TaxID=181762 RepID=A0A8H8CLN6_PSICU|nr:hypothetical protein JR316_0005710 [Psilocybe cubensis]KAH9481190.1 hypothetical protein JR316_0005710 [Psilocybe cubensis]
MEKGQEEVDVAESFVTAFYHDSEDEDVSVQTRNEDIFELYWNSRPLTPLERRNPEDATTGCTGDPTSQIFLIGPKMLSHDNSQSVREDIIRSKSNVGSTENREESDAAPATKRTMPESETASEVCKIDSVTSPTLTEYTGNRFQGLPEEKTPVEEV